MVREGIWKKTALTQMEQLRQKKETFYLSRKKSLKKYFKRGFYLFLTIWFFAYTMNGFLYITETVYAETDPSKQTKPTGQQKVTVDEKGKEKKEGGGLVDGAKELVKDFGKEIGVIDKTKAELEQDKKAEEKEKAQEIAEIQKEAMYEPCSMVDIPCLFTALVANTIKGIFGIIAYLVGNYLSDPMSVIYNNPYIESYYKHFKELSFVFVNLFFLFHSIRLLSMYMLTDDHTEIKLTFQKLVITVFMISALPWLLVQLSEVNKAVIDAIIEKDINLAVEAFIQHTLPKLLTGENMLGLVGGLSLIFAYGGTLSPLMTSIISILALGMLGVVIQMIIRMAELALIYILGPLAIATNMNQRFNYFEFWWKQLLTVLFTTLIQVILLSITIQTFFGLSRHLNLGDVILCIGFIYLNYKTPALLKEWLHSAEEGGAKELGRKTKFAFKRAQKKMRLHK